MDALILAGGPAPPELCSATGCTDRALISLDGQPMVARVLDALRTTRGMEKIVVVASPKLIRLSQVLLQSRRVAAWLITCSVVWLQHRQNRF
jgi:GTP:adenosylcobinamide-phosphate guanylyltransferase